VRENLLGNDLADRFRHAKVNGSHFPAADRNKSLCSGLRRRYPRHIGCGQRENQCRQAQWSAKETDCGLQLFHLIAVNKPQGKGRCVTARPPIEATNGPFRRRRFFPASSAAIISHELFRQASNLGTRVTTLVAHT
jgi:hypothetical protein